MPRLSRALGDEPGQLGWRLGADELAALGAEFVGTQAAKKPKKRRPKASP